MTEYVLRVPLVGQRTSSDGKHLKQPDASGQMRPHGFMACWYAAACMVSYYYRAGPRIGLPRVWVADRGLSIAAIDQLAKIEGLKQVKRQADDLTPDAVVMMLKTHGPIWAAGHFFDGDPRAGHAIVLTGVRGSQVLYNDPWEPQSKMRSWQWLSSNLMNLPNALLAKDAARY